MYKYYPNFNLFGKDTTFLTIMQIKNDFFTKKRVFLYFDVYLYVKKMRIEV